MVRWREAKYERERKKTTTTKKPQIFSPVANGTSRWQN